MTRDIRERLARLELRDSPRSGLGRLSVRREDMASDMQRLDLATWRSKYAEDLSGPQYPIAREIPGYPATTRFLRDLSEQLYPVGEQEAMQ